MSSTPLSVIICTRDRPAQLEEALASAIEHARAGDELIVVDSASSLPAVGEVAAAAGARVVRLERPGLSAARNAGMAAAGTPLVAFTDDDCRISLGWADAIETSLLSEPRVGYVTGRVIADRARRLAVSCFDLEEPLRFEGVTDPTVCGTGANMAFRREACVQVGGFDERLGAGAPLRSGEDTDMFWRLSRAGWIGLYEPSAVVTHVQWRTDGQAVRMAYGYGVGLGALGVKAMRTGDPGGRRFLREQLLQEGLLAAWRDLRGGYQSGAAARCYSAVGALVGAIRTWRRPLSGGRFG